MARGTPENLTNKGKGRPKGSVNKVSADVKAMVLQALHDKGGAEYLAKQAETNPTAFLSLVGKVLPMTIAGDADSPLTGITVNLVQPQG